MIKNETGDICYPECGEALMHLLEEWKDER